MLLSTIDEILQTKKKIKILLMFLPLTTPSQISQQKHFSIHTVSVNIGNNGQILRMAAYNNRLKKMEFS